MHRTTTTALLMMMAATAVSALSGCVTVEHRSAPRLQPSTAPSPLASPTPKSGEKAGPQIVQAPAREALELIESSRRAAPPPGPHTSRPASPRPAPRSSHHHPAPSARPESPRFQPRPAQPLPLPDHHSGMDFCDLGREYGRWQPDSTQEAACRDMYGR